MRKLPVLTVLIITGAAGLLLQRLLRLTADRQLLAAELRDERSERILAMSTLDQVRGQVQGRAPRPPYFVYRAGAAAAVGPFQSAIDATVEAEHSARMFADTPVHLLASVGNVLATSPEPEWEWTGGRPCD
ncbi:hypothetical protein GO986_18810 [Deinococcus sp. HMF7620]|uniref:Uncharacterized protein n=1 Tax=Deinococcus arboris TaxID=2682977 RepID=A0A7C9HTR2_9DEIO|nr:hypothetical protein [Deinococcus arboris]MVN88794.1 hypothetical protein [Deinococcus arboris]